MQKTIKVIALGASFVGKTSILNCIRKGKFDENVHATVSNELFILERNYKAKNMKFILSFCDTAGQERFPDSLTKQFIRNSHIVLLVFENPDTLRELKDRWYKFYKDNTNMNNTKYILVGNKSDTFGNERENIIRLGDEFSEEINAHFITCSAKNLDNIDNLERYIITEAKRFIDEELKNNGNKLEVNNPNNKVIVLKKEENKENSYFKNCINKIFNSFTS